MQCNDQHDSNSCWWTCSNNNYVLNEHWFACNVQNAVGWCTYSLLMCFESLITMDIFTIAETFLSIKTFICIKLVLDLIFTILYYLSRLYSCWKVLFSYSFTCCRWTTYCYDYYNGILLNYCICRCWTHCGFVWWFCCGT